jgi:hypothetical protein
MRGKERFSAPGEALGLPQFLGLVFLLLATKEQIKGYAGENNQRA